MSRMKKKPVTVADLTAKQAAREAVAEAQEYVESRAKAGGRAARPRPTRRPAPSRPAPQRPAAAEHARAESAYRFVSENWDRAPRSGPRRLNVVRLAKTAVRAASEARRLYAERGAIGSARWLAGRGVLWLMRRLP